MTLGLRKLVVVGLIAAVFFTANALLVAHWLDRMGVVSWADAIRRDFLTGTAITIIVALLILLAPTRTMSGVAGWRRAPSTVGRAGVGCEQIVIRPDLPPIYVPIVESGPCSYYSRILFPGCFPGGRRVCGESPYEPDRTLSRPITAPRPGLQILPTYDRSCHIIALYWIQPSPPGVVRPGKLLTKHLARIKLWLE